MRCYNDADFTLPSDRGGKSGVSLLYWRHRLHDECMVMKLGKKNLCKKTADITLSHAHLGIQESVAANTIISNLCC